MARNGFSRRNIIRTKSAMSGCDRPAKQRFKGIENFLRRVAFNLGNTPSQTEVKIISCIPIDVTDLQQKITALERELSEVREATFHDSILCEAKNVKINPNPTRAYTSIVQTALGKPNPTFSAPKVTTQCKCSQAKTPVASHGVNTKLEKGKGRFRRKLSSLCIVSSFSSRNKCVRKSRSRNPEKELQTATKTCCKIVPKRFRRAMRRNRGKTHMIYFTDASKTPFNNYKTSESYVRCDNKSAISKNPISRSYINSMIRKQYESELIVDDLTDISQFSTPACRDSDTESHSSQSPFYYESFKSVDRSNSSKNEFAFVANKGLPIDQGPIVANYQFNDEINYNGYYDSNYYDIYPVKEKSMKYKRDEPFPKQIKRLNSDDFSGDPIRIVNNLRPIVFNNEPVSKRQYKQSYRINDGNGHEYTLTNVNRKRNRNNDGPKVSLNESKLCSIEYGNVYLKHNHAVQGIEKLKPITPTFKNAECLTLNTNNMECQTVESKGVQLNIVDDNKAELALDQIKTILQTVLAEVKTNMRSITESKQKKSVPIQKDVSHRNVTGGSSLLHSFTYNPSCSLNSPCIASFSRHVPSFCYTNYSPVPMKCFQHYPLLVPPIKHFGCNCHHKNKLASEKYKKAAHAETEAHMAQKSETVNLIKEIYKSVPLNVYYSNKATSRNSFGYQKNNFNAEVETANSRVVSVTERSVGDDKVYEAPYQSPFSPASYTANDNTDTVLESIQSEILSQILDRNDAKQSQCTTNYASAGSAYRKTSQTTTSLAEEKVVDVVGRAEDEGAERVETRNDPVRSNKSDSETDSDGTLVADEATQKKEKPGLLMKVLQTVKKLQRKKKVKRQKSAIKDDSLSEDSDTDSQTVYSYKTYRDLKNCSQTNPKQMKSTVQSNRDINRSVQDNLKRLSPYMEQEYRRFWDETLMFNEAKPKLHSSERSFPSWTRSPRSPVYWRHFEARSAILRGEHLKLQENKKECSQMKPKPGAIQQKEKTGFKLEWMKKQKNKAPNK